MTTDIENTELDLDDLDSDLISDLDDNLIDDLDSEESVLGSESFDDSSLIEKHLTKQPKDASLGLLSTIPVKMTVEVSQKQLPINDLLSFEQGQIITLDKGLGEPVDIRVNGVLFASGQIIESDGKYAVKILSLANDSL